MICAPDQLFLRQAPGPHGEPALRNRNSFSLIPTCATALLLGALLNLCAAAPLNAASNVETRKPFCETAKGAEALLEPPRARTLPGLTRERDVPVLASLGKACDALSAHTHPVNTIRCGKQVRIAVQHLGADTNKTILIFIHGVLADRYTWRYMAGGLGREYEIWLLELPGCGESEKPDPDAIEPDGYSPGAMGERVLQALEHLLQSEPGNKHVTLVGHSLGGMVALRMFSDPSLREKYGTVLKRIEGLVLLAPCDVAVNAEIPVFTPVIKLSGWQVGLGNTLGILAPRVAVATRRGFHIVECATVEQAERLTALLTDPARRHAAQAMLTQAVPWKKQENRPDWPVMDQLTANYTNIHVPCLIVWGEWDEVLPEWMGHKLKDHIPGARLLEVGGCGHSLSFEKPVECAEIVRHYAHLMQKGSFGSVPSVSRFSSSALIGGGEGTGLTIPVTP